MYLVKHKRDMEHHHAHVQRVRNMTAHVDTSTPTSLGLKHLATRPKKQQLIDDRHQQIAKENRKLMEKMTKIMGSNNLPEPPLKLGSLNEVERKQAVQRLNFENSLLLDRIKNTPAVIDRSKMDRDFERHRIVGGQLRRRQLQPIDSLVNPVGGGTGAVGSPGAGAGSGVVSPQALSSKKLHAGPSTTFDAQSYITQLSATYLPAGESSLPDGVPMQTMSEFRAKVISSKRMQSPTGVNRKPYPTTEGGGVNTSALRATSATATGAGNDTRFMLQHNPAATAGAV